MRARPVEPSAAAACQRPTPKAEPRPHICLCHVQALRDGVKKHGLGAWEKIRTDPDFAVLRCLLDAHEPRPWNQQRKHAAGR